MISMMLLAMIATSNYDQWLNAPNIIMYYIVLVLLCSTYPILAVLSHYSKVCARAARLCARGARGARAQATRRISNCISYTWPCVWHVHYITLTTNQLVVKWRKENLSFCTVSHLLKWTYVTTAVTIIIISTVYDIPWMYTVPVSGLCMACGTCHVVGSSKLAARENNLFELTYDLQETYW